MSFFVRNLVVAVATSGIVLGIGGAHADTVTFAGLSGPSVASKATVQSITDDSTADTVTFSGGALLTGETWLPANEGTVYYDSFMLTPTTTDAITITFAQPVTYFSVDVYNGQSISDSFSISNGLGSTVMETIAPNNQSGYALVSIPQGGSVFTITDLDAGGYDFSIDDISYTLADTSGAPGGSSVPEPPLWTLMLVGTCALGGAVRKRRRVLLGEGL